MLRQNSELIRLLEEVSNADIDTFSELVRVSKLKPSEDFKFANLQDVDFRGSELHDFDFGYADLRGAIWGELNFSEPRNYRFALRGRKRDPVRGSDYKEIFDNARFSRTWAERFFAFKLAVDNFGENYLTLDLLNEVIRSDNSKYYIVSAFTYFSSSYINNKEAMKYCESMAFGGSTPMNMFRFKKLSRLASETLRFVDATSKPLRNPGDISADKIANLYDVMIQTTKPGMVARRPPPWANRG